MAPLLENQVLRPGCNVERASNIRVGWLEQLTEGKKSTAEVRNQPCAYGLYFDVLVSSLSGRLRVKGGSFFEVF